MCDTSRSWPDSRVFVEATVPGVKRYRTSMKDVREGVQRLFEAILPDIQQVILSAADRDGTLRPERRNDTQRRVGDIVEQMLVGPGQGRRSAFADDGVTARSPFAQFLNEMYVRVTVEAVAGMQHWMQRNLPDDVFQYLAEQGRRVRRDRFATSEMLSEAGNNPFLRRDGESDEAFQQRLADLRVFRPNPLMELDPNRQWVPMHRWNAPGEVKGYRLSDRIWGASQRTRDKIDKLIAEAFAEGQGALTLSRRLERFLLPSRANLRTSRPYGVNASFDAMRLARTEIARAANQAAFVSSYLNPYVNRIDVARSSNGDKTCKICPRHATIGMGGERLRAPYSVHSAMIPVYHPHCMCHTRPVTTDSPQTVTLRLRAVMQDARRDVLNSPVTPAAADAFAQNLLHDALGRLVGQFMGQLSLPGF